MRRAAAGFATPAPFLPAPRLHLDRTPVRHRKLRDFGWRGSTSGSQPAYVLDPNFKPGITFTNTPGEAPRAEGVQALAIQPDGKILVGGYFTSVNGQNRQGLVRLETDGNLDVGFNPSFDGFAHINMLALQNDRKILVAGANVGMGRSLILRLNPDGSPDLGFRPTFRPGTTMTSHFGPLPILMSDHRLLIRVSFTNVDEATRQGLVRLNADGSIDENLNAEIGGQVRTIAIQPDARILVGGYFTAVNGQARTNLVRLNSDGSIDGSFVAEWQGDGVAQILLQGDGKIVIYGIFGESPSGESLYWGARLTSNGAIEARFPLRPSGSLCGYVGRVRVWRTTAGCMSV